MIRDLTPLEKELIEDTVNLWNKYLLLNANHSANVDIAQAIHTIQNEIASRPIWEEINRSE